MEIINRLLRKITRQKSLDMRPAWLKCSSSSYICLNRIFSRGQKSKLEIGEHSNVEAQIYLEKEGAEVLVGSHTHIGANTIISCAEKIFIGNDVLISFDVFITDHDSHSLFYDKRKHDVQKWMNGDKDWSHVPIRPITIGDKSWIGARAIILKGISIGEGAVVAAGSVVTRDVLPWILVGGNPARQIRILKKDDYT